MSRLSGPLLASETYHNIVNDMKHGRYPIAISGCVDSQKSHLIANLGANHACSLVVTYREEKAKELYEDLHFFDEHVAYYPSKDILFCNADIQSGNTTAQRIRVRRRLAEGEKLTIVTGIDVLMEKMIPAGCFAAASFTLDYSSVVEVKALSEKLFEMGYEKTPMVEKPGDYAVRGSIIDIYPLTEDSPVRIDLWGEEIDSIRYFDTESQRQTEMLDQITIYPASEVTLTKAQIADGLERMQAEFNQRFQELKSEKKREESQRLRKTVERMRDEMTAFGRLLGGESVMPYVYKDTASLLDCLPEDTVVFLDEPHHVKDRGESHEEEFRSSMESRIAGGYMLPGQTDLMLSYSGTLERIRKERMIALSSLMTEYGSINPERTYHMEARSIYSYNNSFEQLVKDMAGWRKDNYRMMLMSSSETRARRLARDLMERDLPAYYREDCEHEISPGEILVTRGRLASGFEYPELKYVVLTEKDIFKNRRRKRKSSKRYKGTGQAIRAVSDISIGDYVVHEKYGVGIYKGLEKIESDGVIRDYINIEYKDQSSLFMPASQLDLIEKYASSSARKPALNRLGGNEWEKTKTKVRGQVKIAAKDLVNLYAERQSAQGYCYGEDTVWQKEFEELFPYEETEDQLRAIADTKEDMESRKIMDRLICGDVGYGKTEIAIRAAFKAVQDSKQVAYLVPTTILAQQHYNSFKERMEHYPVNVRMLSRFCSAKEEREIKTGLKKGEVDIVIGTHKLLSKSVEYHDLGLLIIDEEQRFGVKQKEKIKQVRKNVDVLALSATPIPRTLHMSLSGIRDMSILEIPPVDRRAIQTYVMEYNEEMVREAIERELTRNGQVYYVYNRVNNIDDIAARIRKLVPDARVEYAHGQMGERALEDIMNAFISREIDVLVSTTIIETGLDIPNVNTIIIHDAHRYGLSQLYQLRGRVGRSRRTAYAFLMYQRNTILKEDAEKRLKAIREFTDLGSGFKIAMRDLEIRGAGNLLGAEQSGHIEAVGYDLYCKMLNDAVLSMKGALTVKDTFETTIDLPVDAYIPATYVSSENQKLDLYRRIAMVENAEESDDMIDELLDRYGEPPAPVKRLLEVSILKAEAHKAYLVSIEQKGSWITFAMSPLAENVQVDNIDAFIRGYQGKMRFRAGAQPSFSYEAEGLSKKTLLPKVREIVDDIQNTLIG